MHQPFTFQQNYRRSLGFPVGRNFDVVLSGSPSKFHSTLGGGDPRNGSSGHQTPTRRPTPLPVERTGYGTETSERRGSGMTVRSSEEGDEEEI